MDVSGVTSDIHAIASFAHQQGQREGCEIELRWRGHTLTSVDVQRCSERLTPHALRVEKTFTVDEDMGSFTRITAGDDTCIRKIKLPTPRNDLLAHIGFFLSCVYERREQLGSGPIVIYARRYKSRVCFVMHFHRIHITRVVTRTPNLSDFVRYEVEVELDSGVPTKRMVKALMPSIGTLCKTFYPPNSIWGVDPSHLEKNFGEVICPHVRDLQWDDLTADSPLICGGDIYYKDKHDGVRGQVFITSHSKTYWIHASGIRTRYASTHVARHSCIIDGEFSKDMQQLVVFDVPYFDGWQRGTLVERTALVDKIDWVSTIRLVPPLWRPLIEQRNLFPEITANLIRRALIALTENEVAADQTDGWILAANQTPWNVTPAIPRFINSFKIKPVACCSVDLAVFRNGDAVDLFAAGFTKISTVEYWTRLTEAPTEEEYDITPPSHFVKVATVRLEGNYAAGTVVSFLVRSRQSLEVIEIRPDKFMRPNGIGQVSAVIEGVELPICGRNIRENGLAIHLCVLLRRVAAAFSVQGVTACNAGSGIWTALVRRHYPDEHAHNPTTTLSPDGKNIGTAFAIAIVASGANIPNYECMQRWPGNTATLLVDRLLASKWDIVLLKRK